MTFFLITFLFSYHAILDKHGVVDKNDMYLFIGKCNTISVVDNYSGWWPDTNKSETRGVSDMSDLSYVGLLTDE